MHITKLRLLGFKSFVEPTELLIEPGLTGVVGPNGCGKSNLLEALRWCMGETSYKSMRASSMEDVIFNGTSHRPPRNMAEVTMVIDNADRKAPAEFNGEDVLEVTRRIEREMGSAYRVNNRDVRARDIKILFEDAATGARSPALVRQGQIAEIVNAKPEQRRRILEDAAGVAGLHSRRHEADLRLKAAEANLARVNDVIAQVTSQLESLKRQARQARRYKELTEEIRRGEALLHHALWLAIEADIAREETDLRAALEHVATAVSREAALVTREHDAAIALPALREEEAKAAAALQRIKLAQETLEREIQRAERRRAELQERGAQARRDLQREEAGAAEARDALQRLETEAREIERIESRAHVADAEAKAALSTAETAARNVEQRLAGLQTAAAEARARRKSLLATSAERTDTMTRLERQRAALASEIDGLTAAAEAGSDDELLAAREVLEELTIRAADLEDELAAAEERATATAEDALIARENAAAATLASSRLAVEVETLTSLLRPPAATDTPRILDALEVDAGYESALAAALGADLEATLDPASPAYWLVNDAPEIDPPMPAGLKLLAEVVRAPKELHRRLHQIAIVSRADAPLLQRQLHAGQRLVSADGDVWRWDGFVARSEAIALAARHLAERNRLDRLALERDNAEAAATTATAAATATRAAAESADAAVRRLRGDARETSVRLAAARDKLASAERAARERQQRQATLAESQRTIDAALEEATAKRAETEAELARLGDEDPFAEQLTGAEEDAADRRQAVADARAAIATLERDRAARAARLESIRADLARWTSRAETATEHVEVMRERIAAAEEELATADDLPETVEAERARLLSLIAEAESSRRDAADRLAEAETSLREIQSDLRAVQVEVGSAREAKARLEARLEAQRQRRIDHVKKTQDVLGVVPQDCLALAALPEGEAAPSIAEIDRLLTRAKADRDRLGGVNLAAEEDLEQAQSRFGGLEVERRDVEEAIAKLRGAIGDLNKEAKQRLTAAFEVVNGHFQHLFGVLFNGGEARLEMIESETDPLEGGLEIIAKPPGKKPATLSLLSGGEQTLTALSLIFAVFLTNPSPICVLDEVDAPLDDANVDRFCTMMERMAADTTTRFLVITHHPQTMARMNRLFGVTMAEKGVSQLVSVDLEIARSFVEQEAA